MHTTRPPRQLNPLLPPCSPFSSPESFTNKNYSDEDRRILEKAASILAVSVQDLPASLQGIQIPPTIQTSASGVGNATTNDKDNEIADEELVSPFSWPSGSIISSQWSPEAAASAPPIERPNSDELSHFDLIGQNGLDGNTPLFDPVLAPDKAVPWGHIPDQALGIANHEDDLMGQSSFGEIADMAGERPLTAVACSNMELGYPLHGAFLDSSALLQHRDLITSPESAAPLISEPFDVSTSIDNLLAPYDIHSGDLHDTSAYHVQPGYVDGQAVCWPSSRNDVWDWEAGNLRSADPSLDLNLGSHSVRSDDSSANTLLLDQLLQSEPSATKIRASNTLQGDSSASASQLGPPSSVIPFNDIAVEYQSGHASDMNHEVRRRSVQPSDNSAPQQLPSNTLSPARSRYHRPLPGDDHRPKRRQPFKVFERRIETGEMRKVRACVRCRMQRLRCGLNHNNSLWPCPGCQSLSKPTLANLPCVRYKITDSRLFDKGQHPQFKWSKRWTSWNMVEIDQWRSPETKVITITQDVFGGSTFDIVCREFIPIEGDSLQRTWKKNGVTQYYPRAPYAIANMKETGNEIKRFVANNIASSIRHFINVKNDELLQSTYAMAHAMVFRPLQFAHNEKARELLQEVFQLWVAIRMESQSERICGQETLGMEPQYFDRDVNTFGTNSIPPIMSAQIELITTTRILQPLKQSILRKLQKLIKENKLENWFPIYLCLFILLHSCSILTHDEHRAAKKYGLKTRYVYNAFIEELHMGAKIMIYHFHYCNKGSHPFTKEWISKANIELRRLTQEQVQFLLKTVDEVERRRPEFTSLAQSNDYEHDYYFLAQLYDTNWKPT